MLLARAQRHFRPHFRAGFDDGDEHAHDVAALVPERAVAKGEVRPRVRAIGLAFGKELHILGEHGLTGCEYLFGERSNLCPDVVPTQLRGCAKRLRMLGAQDSDAGVVVELDQLRAPPHIRGELGIEADRECRLQRLRPVLDRAERRLRPVQLAHTPRHFALCGQEGERIAVGWRPVGRGSSEQAHGIHARLTCIP